MFLLPHKIIFYLMQLNVKNQMIKIIVIYYLHYIAELKEDTFIVDLKY